MAFAIPHIGAPWVSGLPRPLYFSLRGFDWGFLLNNRDGRTFTFHCRVFGAGVDLNLDEAQKRWSFAIGANWLLGLAFGHAQPIPEEYRRMHGMWLLRDGHRYVSLSVLGFSFDLGDRGEGWTFRGFWRHRRVF